MNNVDTEQGTARGDRVLVIADLVQYNMNRQREAAIVYVGGLIGGLWNINSISRSYHGAFV